MCIRDRGWCRLDLVPIIRDCLGMLHNTNSAVFQRCSKSPFLIGFAKFALRSVATIIDKIRRISVETMSNIPENLDNSTHEESFFVNFMSISFQFYAKRPLRICNFLFMWV